jgi:hypothetical protein
MLPSLELGNSVTRTHTFHTRTHLPETGEMSRMLRADTQTDTYTQRRGQRRDAHTHTFLSLTFLFLSGDGRDVSSSGRSGSDPCLERAPVYFVLLRRIP